MVDFIMMLKDLVSEIPNMTFKEDFIPMLVYFPYFMTGMHPIFMASLLYLSIITNLIFISQYIINKIKK